MGRGGRGGGSRNPANLPREQQVSKKVSWLLRHGVSQEGLELGKGGYVNVQDALNTKALRGLKVTFPELREIVATNDKQRFSMVLKSSLEQIASSEVSSPLQEMPESETLEPIVESQDPSQGSEDPADYLIRANQGHSVKVDAEGLLVPITEEAGNVPATVVHGTSETAWRLIIKSGGLRRMGRNHIHFASGLPVGFKSLESPTGLAEAEKAAPVISGMRKNSSILIYIDILSALAAGIKFYVSENGVILTEGNEQGFLPYQYFKRVENRRQGGGVIMSDGELPDGVVVNVEEWEKEVGDVSGKGRGGGRGGRGGRGGKARANDDTRDLMGGI